MRWVCIFRRIRIAKSLQTKISFNILRCYDAELFWCKLIIVFVLCTMKKVHECDENGLVVILGFCHVSFYDRSCICCINDLDYATRRAIRVVFSKCLS